MLLYVVALSEFEADELPPPFPQGTLKAVKDLEGASHCTNQTLLYKYISIHQTKGSMSAEAIVRSKVRRLLPTVDLDKTSIRQVQEKLVEDLGVELDEHKNVIKEEIDMYLMSLEDEDYNPTDDHPVNKGEEPAAKKQKAAPAQRQQSAGELSISLSSKRFIKPREFNNKPLVDIREYYERDGDLLPGQKGISLSSQQWHTLSSNLTNINTALEAKDEAYFCDLGSKKRAGVSSFRGKMMIDVREYYEKDGEMKPGKKGISLPPDQWTTLCATADAFNAAVPGSSGTGRAPSTASPPLKEQQQEQQQLKGENTAPTTATEAAAGPSNQQQQQQQQQEQDTTDGIVHLSNNRRAEVQVFKGKVLVSIREYYEKDGKMLPGKKGISLTKDQFNTLMDHAQELTDALTAKNVSVSFELPGGKRSASINEFRGKLFVDVREFYEQDGERKPGRSGISLSGEQWEKFCAGGEDLKNRMSSA